MEPDLLLSNYSQIHLRFLSDTNFNYNLSWDESESRRSGSWYQIVKYRINYWCPKIQALCWNTAIVGSSNVQQNKHIFLLPTLQLTRQKGLYILHNNILFIIRLPFLGLWSCSKNQRSPQHSESIGTLIYAATPSIHRSEPFLCFCQKSCGIKPGCANFHLINSWIETRYVVLAKSPKISIFTALWRILKLGVTLSFLCFDFIP